MGERKEGRGEIEVGERKDLQPEVKKVYTYVWNDNISRPDINNEFQQSILTMELHL